MFSKKTFMKHSKLELIKDFWTLSAIFDKDKSWHSALFIGSLCFLAFVFIVIYWKCITSTKIYKYLIQYYCH